MRKYEKGKRITSVGEFEKLVAYGQRLFIIGWGNEGMTRHYGFIQSFQYSFLKNNIINGKGLWVAKPKAARENENEGKMQ
jgi:hypothetical protein